MAGNARIHSSSSGSESSFSSHDESDFDSESDSFSDDSEQIPTRGSKAGKKAQSLAPLQRSTGSSNSLWLAREKQFEHFRNGLVILPLPDGVQRIEKARGYSLHIMSVLNWALPEAILSCYRTNYFQRENDDSDDDDSLILTLGAHVSLFHAPTKRFFGNTWVSPELPVDPSSIKQGEVSKNSSVRYVIENVSLNFRAYFISDVVDANCVGVVELVAYQKDPDSKATVKSIGCGWTIVPLFTRSDKGTAGAPPSAFSMDTSGQSVKIFIGSPRVLWELPPSAWNSQETHESCKFFYQLVQYDPILSIAMFLRRNELVGALDIVPGLKNGNMANIDVGRNPKMLLWEEQDSTYEEALATFAKLASLVPKSICAEETFELSVIATRVAIHLRPEMENDLIARLKISRKAIYEGATSIDGEISARVLKVALHNGRCFRSRQYTVPLKADQKGDDTLRCVQNRTRLKGFVFHPSLAIILVLQYTVHFRLEWPAKLKQQAIDAKKPLPPEQDVVLVTVGSRAIVPSDGKKLYLYDKHHLATAFATHPIVIRDKGKIGDGEEEQRILHVDLLSGAPCRAYSDTTLYTPPNHVPLLFRGGSSTTDESSIAFCDIRIVPSENQRAADNEAEAAMGINKAPPSPQAAAQPSNQLSDGEDVSMTEGQPAERWARKLLGKANNNALLAQVLDTLADEPAEPTPAAVSPLKLPSPSRSVAKVQASPKKQVPPASPRVNLPSQNEYRGSELSRASKTLLARYGYLDAADSTTAAKLSSPSNQESSRLSRSAKKGIPRAPKLIDVELKDVYKMNDILFHFAALRTSPGDDAITTGDTNTLRIAATRVYFTFQFYTFPPTRTETLRLSNAFDSGSGGESQTYLLMREQSADKPSLAVRFEVDTTATRNPLETRRFAEYLLTKNLYVDIWDADSLFLIGTFAVPLHELLRQGAGIKKFQAELEILEPNDGVLSVDSSEGDDEAGARVVDVPGLDGQGDVVIGKMQVLMSNYGLKGEHVIEPTAELGTVGEIDDQELIIPSAADEVSAQKKRRVRARPLVDSNPELYRLLAREGFYGKHDGKPRDAAQEEAGRRRQQARGASDATSLSEKEVSILCELFGSRKPSASKQPTRINCDREGGTGLVALLSLRPKAVPASMHGDPTPIQVQKPMQVREPVREKQDEAAKVATSAHADRLQRVMRIASNNKVALEDAFQLFDADKDGFLSHAEFVNAMRSLGSVFADTTDAELVALADSMDANKDGRIDYAEFVAYLTRSQTAQERVNAWRDRIKRIVGRAVEKGIRVHQVFAQLDSSGDGKLSLVEFEAALKQLGIPLDKERQDLDTLLAEFDTDHDGQISYHEFIQSLGIAIEQNSVEVVAETSKDIVKSVREVMKRLETKGVAMDEVFVHFDTDKSGSLSIDEFMAAMNQLLQSDIGSASEDRGNVLKSLEREAALKVMRSVNADGDDKIDYKEFLTFCGVSQDKIASKEEAFRLAKQGKAEKKLVKLIVRACMSGLKLDDIFKHFDANLDGDITLSEFHTAFEQLFQGQKLDAQDIEQISSRFDTNHDGKVSFQEFQKFGGSVVSNQRTLLALLTPHVDTLTTLAKSGSKMTAAEWKSACKSKLRLSLTEVAPINKLLSFFDLFDADDSVNLSELLALLKTVAPAAPPPNNAKPVADEPVARLKKLLLRAKEQGVDVKSSFGHFDADGSGEITREELKRGLLSLGCFDDVSEAEFETMIRQLDVDGSGKISFDEFQRLIGGVDASSVSNKPATKPTAKSKVDAVPSSDSTLGKLKSLIATAVEKGVTIESCFQHFDKNQDGKISKDEFVTAMAELGLAREDALLAEVVRLLDSDGSGEISLAEFKRLLSDDADATLSTASSAASNSKPKTATAQATKPTAKPHDAAASDIATDKKASTIERLRALLVTAKTSGVDVEASFAHFDTDGDGSITSEEFSKSLKQLPGFENVKDDEITAVIAALDSNASGAISLSEFHSFIETRSEKDVASVATKPPDTEVASSSNEMTVTEQPPAPENTTTQEPATVAKDAKGDADAQALLTPEATDTTAVKTDQDVVAVPGDNEQHRNDEDNKDNSAAKPATNETGSVVEGSADPTNKAEAEGVKKTKPPARAGSFTSTRGKPLGAKPSFAARRAGTDSKAVSDAAQQDSVVVVGPSEKSAVGTDIVAGTNDGVTPDEVQSEAASAVDSAASESITVTDPLTAKKTKPPLRSGSFSSTRGKPPGAKARFAAHRANTDSKAVSDAAQPDSVEEQDPSKPPVAGADVNDSTTAEAVPSDTNNATEELPGNKAKPPVRAGSFTATRGKPLGAKPSFASRRSNTDSKAIKDEASADQTPQPAAETESTTDVVVAAKSTKPAGLGRRPSFAAARAAKPGGAVSGTSGSPPTDARSTGEEATKTAAVTTELTHLRALLAGAQKSGVDIQQSFERFDKDQNGQLTYDEFAQALRELGPDFQKLTSEQVTAATRELDHDQRGEISVSDLVRFVNSSEIEHPGSGPAVGGEVTPTPDAQKTNGPHAKTARGPRQPLRRSSISKPPASKPPVSRQSSVSSLVSAKADSGGSSGAPLTDRTPSDEASRATGAKASTSTPRPGVNSSVSTPHGDARPPTTTEGASATNVTAGETQQTVQSNNQSATAGGDDCSYVFSTDPEIRAVELKLRKAVLDAYSRGVLPLRVLSKFLDDSGAGALRFKPAVTAQPRTELLRVEFLQVLMELGFSLLSDRADGDDQGSLFRRGARMHDHLYARQLERLARYKHHIKEEVRAQKQLVRAVAKTRTVPHHHRQQADAAADSLQRFDDDKRQLMRVLAYYRDGQKKGLMYSLLREQMTTSLTLFPAFAELLFWELPFANPYGHHERFRVELLLPTNRELALLVDVDVVRSSPEWVFYRRHIPLATSGAMVGKDEDVEKEMIDDHNEFVMDTRDRLVIPMRLRWLDTSSAFSPPTKRSRQQTEQQPVVPVSVLVKSCSHGHTVALFKLSLRPQPFVCHRVLRFSHPAASIWRTTLRCPRGTFAVCLDPRVVVDSTDVTTTTNNYEVEDQLVRVKCRVGEYPSLEEFVLVLYADQYCARVFQVWQLRVQARLRVDVHAVTGQRVTTELVIRSGDTPRPRRVQCFTTREHAARLAFRPSRVFQLVPRAFNRIEAVLCAADVIGPAALHALVNLVDVESRELVGAWSVHATLAKPAVTKSFALELPLGRAVLKKFAYANPWDAPQTLVLRSSAPRWMSPRDAVLHVPGRGQVFVRLAFRPRLQAGEEAMYLFINDQPTDQHEEALRFLVTYA